MNLQAIVLKIVAEATENDVTQVTLASNQGNLVGWDSLAQLSIMSALSSQFPQLEDSEALPTVSSVAEIIELCMKIDG